MWPLRFDMKAQDLYSIFLKPPFALSIFLSLKPVIPYNGAAENSNSTGL